MLKKLTPRHREAIRRLAVGESQAEVAEELGISPGTVFGWTKDPLFMSELREIEERALVRLTNCEERLDALTIIQEAAGDAAKLCSDVVKEGRIGDEPVNPGLRIKSAWDILDRSGNVRTERREVGIYDIADLVRLAEERYGSEGPKDRNSN